MKAGELMTRSFQVVHPDAPLEHVASRFGSPGAGPILVCEHGRLIGMLDPRELGTSMGIQDPGARAKRVRDVLAPDVLYCLESTDLGEAVALMREYQARAIPVLSADRRLVGIVALEDLPDGAEPSHVDGCGERGTKRA